MRELPEEHYPEERRGLDSDLVAGRRPSEQRWQSSGKSADECAPMRARFERRIKEKIARQRDHSPERRQRIEKPREIGFGDQRDHDSENERAARGQFTGGQGAHIRPPHQGVQIALPILVERVDAARKQRHADRRMKQWSQSIGEGNPARIRRAPTGRRETRCEASSVQNRPLLLVETRDRGVDLTVTSGAGAADGSAAVTTSMEIPSE